ncbi:hypothetical protein PPYR_05863 [Photinus pyralis]|uniref:Signal recognition particle subunit SRP72 n=1 Tax=Photinus pyralis TaxID=7054 RepID=A0A1Y1N8S3_PHOPY|nr:signal recognition particle subunit SRP72 [Photinus pyralis]KAB0801509.1 hypothetical protein PPYR_05863 [Photinus pyralis]
MDGDKADPKEKLLSNAFLDLQRLGQNGEYDRALKVTNRILQLSPQDENAFNCKIVCLIHLSKFNEVLQLMQRQAALSKDLHFEKAYCQYRLNQTEEALATVEQAEQSYRIKELKAQILYRLESFSECLSLYRDVIKNTHDDYSDERETNLTAVVTQLQHMNVKNDTVKLRSDTYELCYNWACILIAQGRYSDAEKKLKVCEKLCRGSLEEDGASEDEIEIELALLKVQLAYVYQKRGQTKEAYEMYTAALKLKLDDTALIAVASNNIVSINKGENVFDSKKKMKAATSEGLIHKLPANQRRQIALNNAILTYYTNNFDLCNKACERVEEAWPSVALQARITHALSLTKCNSHSKAIALLNNYKSQNNEEQLYVKLVIVHLLLTQGEQAEACKVLESMGPDSYKPAIVGALITLYLGMKKKDTALKVFERTVDWYKTNKIKADLSSMWRQAADMHMRNGQAVVAANSLEELVRSNPSDFKSVAHLALAYMQFDKKKAATLMNKFPKSEKQLSQREIDALESASWITLKKTAHKPEQSPGTPKAELNKVKNKKKRKPRLPKNYDSTVAPDPERWLPKYERTGFRKRRDRRAKEVIKGSQGTTSAQADQYDFSKISEEIQKSPPMSSVEPSPQPKNRQKKPQQNKKKNKRR